MTVFFSLHNSACIMVTKNVPYASLRERDLLNKVKHAAGVALALLGLGILLGAALSLLGYLAGVLTISTEPIHPFFMTGIACTFCGFHLNSETSMSPSVNAGPFTFNF